MIFFIVHAYNLQKQVPTFIFFLKSLHISMKLLTFANDHRHIPQWRAGVTFVGKQFKHSLLFRVQPKASETYWK